MKPTKEIIGLRIISILDGTQVSSVKDIVINPQGKSMDFVIVDQPSDIFGAKVISFADILGIGEFAITIPEPSVIQDVVQSAEAQNLLRQDTKVIGTKVLTKKGQMIGEVTELIVDEDSGRVAACLFNSQDQICQVEVDQIITFGKELLIIEGVPGNLDFQVNTQIKETLTAFNSEPMSEVPVQAPEMDFPIEQAELPIEAQAVAEPVTEMPAEPQIAPQTESQVEPVAQPIAESVAEMTEEAAHVAQPAQPATSFNLFEQRQLQYFIGKRVEKDIVLDNSEVLRAGETITPETVSQITTKTTLMEVSSHLQKN